MCEALLRDGIKDDHGAPDVEQTFWVKASLVEALLGAGETAKANELRAAITGAAPSPEGWMLDSMNDQLAKLEALLAAAPAMGSETTGG
jgi:hypothetical protein